MLRRNSCLANGLVSCIISVTSLKANVYGIVAGIPLPFPLPNANACKNCNLQCPLPANSSETYISAFPVLDTYPEVSILKNFHLHLSPGVGFKVFTCLVYYLGLLETYRNQFLGISSYICHGGNFKRFGVFVRFHLRQNLNLFLNLCRCNLLRAPLFFTCRLDVNFFPIKESI